MKRALQLVGATALATGTIAHGAAPENLVLVTIDTIRADYLSCNGSTRVRTPNLDALAAGGVNFTRARSSVPLTLPSHASILTGNYPPTHTLRDNALSSLPPAQVTITERLQGRGYRTAAFLASFVLDRRFGLNQGFEVYDDRAWNDISMLERLDAERPAEAVYASFRSWLAGHPAEQPFFAWIHLFDPHAPYSPPEPFKSQFPDDAYAAEVAYVDSVIGRLVADLSSRKLVERTIVAVVGDHGESLGEHGENTHGLLIHNSTLHVPMLIYARGTVPSGTVVNSLVRTIDLAPTLLDFLGAGASLGEGVSLRELITANRDDPMPKTLEIAAYSESLYPQLHLGWSPQYGLELSDARLILTPQPELYDVVSDPGETENIFASRRDLYRRVRRQLDETTSGFPETSATGDPGVLDEAATARLRALGYLAGSPAPRSTVAISPKDRLDVWRQIELALAAFGLQDYSSATPLLEELLETEPDISLLYDFLGSSYMRLERWQEAEATYRSALDRGIETASMHVDLGRILQRRGDHKQAETAFRAALELEPSHVEALYRLGDLHRLSRKLDSAIDHYRGALAINRDYVYAWNGLAIALSQLGRHTDAEAAFREAVRVQPEAPLGHLNLALQLERMGRVADARSELELFVGLTADDARLSDERQRALDALRRLAAADP